MILLFVSLVAADQFITGVVKDAAGMPAAGVAVAVSVSAADEGPIAETDSAGRFSLAVPKALQGDHPRGGLIAFHPELGLAAKSLLEGERSGVALTLAKAPGARVPVKDVEGKPLKDKRTAILRLRLDETGLTVPKSLKDRFSTRTDEQGIATFKHVPAERIWQLSAETAAGVTQMCHLKSDADDVSFQASPTTTVRGRFVGAPWPKGAEVVLQSSAVGSASNLQFMAMEIRVKPGDDGAFTATVLAGGPLQLMRIDNDAVWVSHPARPTKATPGAEFSWTIGKTTPVTGIVRTGDGKPAPNSIVHFRTQASSGATMTSGADGRYSGRVPPGKLNYIVQPSAEFGYDRMSLNHVEIPESPKPYEMPPIIVSPTSAITGVVKDDNGAVVQGAQVAATCTISGGSRVSARTAVTGTDGEFRIAGIPKESRVTLRAFHNDRGAFSDSVDAKPNESGKQLTLKSTLGASLVVNPVDESGKPIGAAELQVEQSESSGDFWFQPLRGELFRPIKMTAPGPKNLGAVPHSIKFRVTAKAPGYNPAVSSWVSGDQLKSPVMLKLKRGIELGGRVVDSSGKPISGAMVKPAGAYGSDASATTDSDGRFKVSGLPCSTAVVTAYKPGWRHGGGVVKDGKPATIVLKRSDEPAPRAMAKEFPNRAANELLAKRLTDPLAEAVFSDKGDKKPWWAQSYAYMNPSKLLDMLDGKQWSDEDRDFARYHIAVAFAESDVDEAIAQANAITKADQKASALHKVATLLPDSANDKRRKLLADALAAVRAGTEPAMRTLYIAKIGEELHKLGDPVGEKTIREAHEDAKKLPKEGWSSYAVGCVAESLALVDFAAAMELTKDLPGHKGEDRSSGGSSDSYAFNRHRGNIAHKIAALQPPNAERALMSMTESGNRSRIAARVCYRMAPVILDRAKRIAGAASNMPVDRASALCVMAIALGPEKRSESASMVREAFAALRGADDAFPFGGGPIALSFLDAAVVAVPNDVDEYFWKALAMPGSMRNSFRNPHAATERLGAIGAACLLSQRFDAEVAAGFAAALAAEADAIVGQLGEIRGGSDSPMLALAGLLAADPQSVEVVVKKWPTVVGGGSLATADRARLTVGSMLMASPAKRNDRIAERFLHRWIIDKEDL